MLGVFEGDSGPCGINFNKETLERKDFAVLESIFKNIKQHLNVGDFKAKFSEIAMSYFFEQSPIKRVVFLGLGKKTDFTDEKARQAAAKAAQYLRDIGLKNFTMTLFGSPVMNAKARFKNIFEGAALALYKYSHKTQNGEEKKIEEIEFLFPETIQINDSEWQDELEKNKIIISSVYWARDMVNAPASIATPQYLAQIAQKIAKTSAAFECQIFGKEDLERMKMNAILDVGKGSHNEPNLIFLKYKPANASNQKPIVLIGKGVCFDSGGLSLKPSENMDEMKMDMAGAAATLASIKAASDLRLPLYIIAAVPALENIPGPKSYKPGDIIKTHSGKTIEVLNTDAEGRIVLADVLSYASLNFNPEIMIDLATLTSASITALGHHYGAILGTNDKLMADLVESGKKTNEKIWPLPMDDDYKKQIESEIADVKNIGGRPAGAITAAMFLKEFAGETPWAHIDIAGPAILSEKSPYSSRGASGFGVRLLLDFLEKRLLG